MRHLALMLILIAVPGCSRDIAPSATSGDRHQPLPIAAAPAGSVQATGLSLSGFPLADHAREFVFPRDHGKHPEYETEWWYYTGTLSDDNGHDFGVQVTIFRRALTPPVETGRAASWATRDVYLAHFAIADLSRGTFTVAERLARGAGDLADASLDSHDVHLLDWTVSPISNGFHLNLADTEKGIGLRADNADGGPPILHGVIPGLSLKGGPNQASYYYSLPRIRTVGTLTSHGKEYPVAGLLWMDHEFGSNQLAPGQRGWEWFAFQFDDGSSVMLYQLRRSDGTVDPASSGTWIGPDGTTTHLLQSDFTLTPTRTWKSPQSGGEYPVAWHCVIPSVGCDVTVTPRLDACELVTTESTGITYWEGPIRTAGTHAGHGYLEMTGYVESLGARF
ncbi:MAG: lipocalin-like domain-containing protein [bacterium]